MVENVIDVFGVVPSPSLHTYRTKYALLLLEDNPQG